MRNQWLALFVTLFLLVGVVPAQQQAENKTELKNVTFKCKTLSPLSASVNKKGDRFTLLVLEPQDYRNAQIEGEVEKAKASGKVKGKSEFRFGFDKLLLADGTEIPISADLVSVANSQGVEDVDEEGHVIGKSSKKKDLTRTAVLSGLGALVGGLAGGGKGAVAGAAIGAGIGLSIAFSTRGEDIQFASGSTFYLGVTQSGDPVSPK